jgi:predicted dehydrogenase
VNETHQAKSSEYALETKTVGVFDAPELPYRPPMPKHAHRIGLIGCGGISQAHLDAYRHAGFTVAALSDKSLGKAEKRRDTFFPEARITSDALELIGANDVDVLDITPHPEDRVPLVRAALMAGKHVLSQKPFVTDLDVGLELCNLADANGVKLAVNQNGRWAPHLAYMREAVQAGVIGEVISAHVGIHWDHTWTAGTPFEKIEHLVLYDFGIHWFDFVSSLLGDRARTVRATRAFAHGQGMKIPMLAQVLVEFEGGQASLIFDAHVRYGPQDATYVGGTRGSLTSIGPNLDEQSVTLYTAQGIAHPKLTGAWFNDGFQGAMGELLVSIEEDRQPLNNARDNLRSLELCFAAIQSSVDGAAKRPGEVRKLEVTQ